MMRLDEAVALSLPSVTVAVQLISSPALLPTRLRLLVLPELVPLNIAPLVVLLQLKL